MVNRSEHSVGGEGGGRAASLPTAVQPAMVNGKRKFCKHFKAVADCEQLLSCYLCSMPQDGPRAGMLYLSASWICFYSKMLSKKIKVVINIPKVTSITQEKTAKIIPNAIRITTDTESYVFASFVSRNHVYKKLLKLWKNSETASDSGASDIEALQQMSQEGVLLSGAVSFQLSDSEDVSSESSMPLAIDCADGSGLTYRKSPTSHLTSTPRWLTAGAAAEPPSSPASSSAAQVEPHSTAAAVTPDVPAAAATAVEAAAAASEEQGGAQSEPIAASPPPLLRQRSSTGSKDRPAAVKLLHGQLLLGFVRSVAVHLAAIRRQSIMLIITVALCFSSTVTMYRLSMLETSAVAGSGGRTVSSSSSGHWHGHPDVASMLSGSVRPSDRIIVTILDSNVRMLQEIKDSLDLLKTLLDRRQQQPQASPDAAPVHSIKDQGQPSEVEVARPSG